MGLRLTFILLCFVARITNVFADRLSKPSQVVSADSFWEDFKSYESNDDFAEEWICPTPSEKDQIISRRWYLARNDGINSGIIVKAPNAVAMIGRLLHKPIIINNNDTLVVQYEVKASRKIKCDGAFLKLFQNLTLQDIENYNSEIGSEYKFLFGPDYCLPDTNKLRFELQGTSSLELTHCPVSKLNDDLKRTHLYTTALNFKDKIIELRIDGKVVLFTSIENRSYFNNIGNFEYTNEPLITVNSIVFDNWGSTSGLMFNNIYIGKDIIEAEKIGNITYSKTREKEEAELQEKLRFRNDGKNTNVNKQYFEIEHSGNLFDIIIDTIIENCSLNIIWTHKDVLLVTLLCIISIFVLFNRKQKVPLATEKNIPYQDKIDKDK
ncbi:hypothetical protein RNJ44_02583 [Nakaseomyces bracarensis]|uniref:Uncharacterized protein n=1 Tax=Nakaseomyces bracarensis TaxID=273131 RepID=A0ABR4NMA1_9SACH